VLEEVGVQGVERSGTVRINLDLHTLLTMIAELAGELTAVLLDGPEVLPAADAT